MLKEEKIGFFGKELFFLLSTEMLSLEKKKSDVDEEVECRKKEFFFSTSASLDDRLNVVSNDTKSARTFKIKCCSGSYRLENNNYFEDTNLAKTVRPKVEAKCFSSS